MRETLEQENYDEREVGITPAYAGNTVIALAKKFRT